ncbi:hypothetical protein ACS0TY_026654 [Phlomoides rotata]
MAEQGEEGWPLGLHPVNVRAGLVRIRDFNASLSSNTLLTSSPISSTDSSSDLDTEHLLVQSTGSLFHDKSMTLGSLMGISSILELSRRSTRGRIPEPAASRNKKNYKTKTWFFSLCSRLSEDADHAVNNAPSLAHFLQAQRRGGRAVES